MSVGRTLGPIAALVASAALGGVVAVGAVALLGGLGGGDTTVVTETSAAGGPALAPAGATGLSVHERLGLTECILPRSLPPNASRKARPGFSRTIG